MILRAARRARFRRVSRGNFAKSGWHPRQRVDLPARQRQKDRITDAVRHESHRQPSQRVAAHAEGAVRGEGPENKAE